MRGLGHAWTAACALAVIVVAAIMVAWLGFGMVPIAVQSGSMEPNIPVHSLVFVQDVPAESVRVGDVITFDPPGSQPRTTHRVAARVEHGERWYFTTKGDANPVADDWRKAQQDPAAWMHGVTYGPRPALRVAFHVPQLGRLATVGEHPRMRIALLAAPFLLFALWVLRAIWFPPRRSTSRVRAFDADDRFDWDEVDLALDDVRIDAA